MGACRLTNTIVQYDERDCYGQMVLRLPTSGANMKPFSIVLAVLTMAWHRWRKPA
jgi:hypothetical protein